MITNKYKLLSYNLTLVVIVIFAFNASTQEKLQRKEVEEPINSNLNNDYWKNFGKTQANNSKIDAIFSSPVAIALMKIPDYPFDTITISHQIRPTTTYKVEPIEKFFRVPAPDNLILFLRVLNNELSFREVVTAGPSAIKKIKFFEETVVEIADGFIKGNETLNSGQLSLTFDLISRLEVTEAFLEKCIRFHDSALATDKRYGSGWDGMRKIITSKLLAVRIAKIKACNENKKWDEGLLEISKLTTQNLDKETIEGISELLVEIADESNKSGTNQSKIRDLLRAFLFMESKVYTEKSAKPLSIVLKKKANALYLQAEKSQEKLPVSQLTDLLLRSLELQPDYIKAIELLDKISPRKEMFRIGLTNLPENSYSAICPLDAEIHAADLVYESLYRLETGTDQDSKVVPELASSRISFKQNIFKINLRQSIFWSDGKPLNPIDIFTSVKKNKNLKWIDSIDGFFSDWNTNEANLLSVTSKSSNLDPYAFFQFKIHQESNSDIGSGPFRFSHKGTELGKNYISYKAQPFYRFRKENSGKPFIQEVRFNKTTNPLDELLSGKIDFASELNLQDIAKLKEQGGNSPFLTAQTGVTFPNKRVYFLAINTADPKFDQPEVRKAIAHAINRSKILSDIWIGSGKAIAHNPLNTIFPKDYNFQQEKDKNPENWSIASSAIYLNQAFEIKNKKMIEPIVLKFPAGDPYTLQAINQIAVQIKVTLGINIITEPINAASYLKDVILNKKYELAYAWHDFEDENCSLYPLLFNYHPWHSNESKNMRLLLETSKQTMLAQTIPEMIDSRNNMITLFEQELPMIPLWQLDRFWAWRKDLNPTFSDGLHLFQNLSSWKKGGSN